MNFEKPQQLKIEIEDGYENLIPEEFKTNPLDYFQTNGTNLTPWKENIKVKQFLWDDISVVAKIVSTDKHPEDPLYEYKIMKVLKERGLPGPKPIATIEGGGKFMIITECITGINFSGFEDLLKELKSKGYTDGDIEKLTQDAEQKMKDLRDIFEAAGVNKDYHKDHWKLKDMVFEVDIENKNILSVTPTDFERTKITK